VYLSAVTNRYTDAGACADGVYLLRYLAETSADQALGSTNMFSAKMAGKNSFVKMMVDKSFV